MINKVEKLIDNSYNWAQSLQLQTISKSNDRQNPKIPKIPKMPQKCSKKCSKNPKTLQNDGKISKILHNLQFETKMSTISPISTLSTCLCYNLFHILYLYLFTTGKPTCSIFFCRGFPMFVSLVILLRITYLFNSMATMYHHSRHAIFFLLVLEFLVSVRAWNKFCSVICANNSCNTDASGDCTGPNCFTPWTWNTATSSCEMLPTSGWEQVDMSNDVGGGLVSNLTTTTTCGPQTGGSLWTYSYIGNITSSNTIIRFTNTAGVSVGHYQLRIIFWAILIDNWNGGDTFSATLEGNQTKTQTRNSRISSEKVCGNGGDWDDLVRFDQTYTHNTTTPFTVDVKCNVNNKWGMREMIVLARLCNVACLTCFGPANTQCYSCEQDTPMLLSATTCAIACLPGYGMKIDGMNCVLCDLKCAVCFELSTNCSQCKSSGTYASFLFPSNNSCLTSCPIGYYGNFTDRTCYPCDPSCVSCKTLPTYCFQCNLTLGYAWNSYNCYNPCPVGMFLNNNSHNCTACSPYCIECVNTSTTCTSCILNGTYMAYLLGTDCLRVCPNNYYEDTAGGTVNTCQPCFVGCLVCDNNPSPCSACNPNYWLYNSQCGISCPDLYFPDNVTWKCLLCDDYCVALTMKMYFPDSTNSQINIDMTFTEDLDYTTFPYQTFQTLEIISDMYTMDMFQISFNIINGRTYRIIMQPKGYIFLYNATVKCTTMDLPSVLHRASNGRPFKEIDYGISDSLVWFVIKAPDMSDIEKTIINGVSNMSNMVRDVTTKPYMQEIKKAGIFGMLFAGAQITSCSVLINSIPSQNLYEGVRFWAIFVFFDVPPWEKNSDKTKYVVVPPVSDVIKDSRLLEERRQLFDTSSIEWRFARTGHTSFFLFDVYPVIFMVLFCWLLLAIGFCLNKKKPLLFKKHMGKFYTFLHKVHEISIMYIMLSTIMEFLYFSSNAERWLSLGFCILANVYFLIYELYIYYEMIKYPVAQIGNEKYEFYAIKYGSYLKNIRYEQYDMTEPWSPKQWFRPYNYHILSYYKKLMMIVSLPLFYHTTHAQIGVLILLQGTEILRFCCIWPFYQQWRNIYRLVLECALEMFFICVLIQGFLVQEIMRNDDATLMNSIQLFYRFGWVGFGMVFLFNIGFIVLYIFDLVRGCRMSNRKMMDQARKIYYYKKLKAYEEENEDVPLGLVNKWVKLGNLNERNYDELPDVNIRVEYFRLAKMQSGNFEIEMKKLIDLFMNIEFNFSKENNVNSGKKLNKRFTLTRELSKDFYYLIDDLYRKYSSYNLEYITVKTFQRVEQSLSKPGDKVELQREKMSQKIILELHTGQKKTLNLDTVMPGFPVSPEDLARIP